jgi:hypothetical protein
VAVDLAGAIRLLSVWGAQVGESPVPVHGLCGTPLEVRFWCPTCQQVAGDEDDDVWA